MILRVVYGRVRPGELSAVVDSFRRAYVPAALRTEGLGRYMVAARPAGDGGHHLAAMTIWESVEMALVAYGGDLAAPRTLDGRSHGVRFDQVDFYELEAFRTAPTPARERPPVRLRLTAGMVARGLDADIQQELRARLPDLPAEAIEAYVGRRVLGSAVEIAFVSTWAAEPPGVPLDAPLWPEISDRYDTFRLEVHEVALEGAGPSRSDGTSAD